jgi:hypothetical protein
VSGRSGTADLAFQERLLRPGRERDMEPRPGHDSHITNIQAQLGAAAGYVPRHRHLGQGGAVLGDQPLADAPGCVPPLGRNIRSASSHPSITTQAGPEVHDDRRPDRGQFR